jgi:hypothetical protein
VSRSREEIEARQRVYRRALELFDQSALYPAAPLWHTVRDPHTMANIKESLAGAAYTGHEEPLAKLARRYWPEQQQEAALRQLRRIYERAREGEPDAQDNAVGPAGPAV